MKVPRVLCDVDNVVADYPGHVLAYVKDFFKKEYTHEHVTQFEILDAIDLTDDEKRLVRKYMEETPSAFDMPIIDGSREALILLNRISDLWFITVPLRGNKTWSHDREQWFGKHFPLQRFEDRIITTRDKSFIPGDIFIDDKPQNVEGWADSHPHGLAFLWEGPWNAELKKGLPEKPLKFGATPFLEAEIKVPFLPSRNGNIVITKNWTIVLAAAHSYSSFHHFF